MEIKAMKKMYMKKVWKFYFFETVFAIEKLMKSHEMAYRDDTISQYNIKDFNINDSLVFSNFD